MQRTHSRTRIALAIALAGAAPLAFAQAYPSTTSSQHPQTGAMTHTPPYQSPPPQDQNPSGMPARIPSAGVGEAMGQHDMSATVKSISANDIVDVRTDDGVLRVHFPDAGKNLKKGDKITLHLSYTMDASPPSSP